MEQRNKSRQNVDRKLDKENKKNELAKIKRRLTIKHSESNVNNNINNDKKLSISIPRKSIHDLKIKKSNQEYTI